MEKFGKFSKAALSALLLIMMLAVCVPVNAAVIEIETNLRVMVAPNPAEVNKPVVVTVQLDRTNPLALGVAGGEHFRNFRVTIQKPDGTSQTEGPYEAWSTSSFFFFYTPTMEGEYVFQASFPGQWANTTTVQYWYKPSTSRQVKLTVQSEPIQPYPSIPLPSDYWTRPLTAELKGAWQIADNWLMQSYDYATRSFCACPAFAPYTLAPNSPHILWTKQHVFGGMAGGSYEDKAYYTGLSYEQWYNPLIVNGRIIYTEHPPTSGADIFGTRCIDLYTGEEIWYLPNVNIAFAQIIDTENPNEHGLIAHLWEASGPATNTTLKMYDAFTGQYIMTIKNVLWGGLGSFGTCQTVFGSSGEILSYTLDAVRGRLILWNSSKAIYTAFPWIGGEVGMIYSPRVGSVVDGRLGIEWNVTIPKDVPRNSFIRRVEGGYILVANVTGVTATALAYDLMVFPAKLEKSSGGKYPDTVNYLWRRQITDVYMSFFKHSNIAEGVFAMFDEAKLQFHCYDIKTGRELWKSEPLENGWAQFTYNYYIAYGKLYSVGYDGYFRAYDIKTGKLAWEFYFGNSGMETVYGSWPTYAGFTIADHKIYVTNDEHSPDSVLWRGAKLWCLDADTGALVWSIAGMMRHGAISDGIYTVLNSYDGVIYTFGKGPSATSVYVQQDVVSKGSTILIKGTVTDQSPAQKGTPCVAKESMSSWMEYLHMQRPIPAEVKGVSVELYAIYPDGSYNYIGTATTEPMAGGIFSFAWAPPKEGMYTIIAVFKGDESYGSSQAGTKLLAVSAPEAPAPATAEQAQATQAAVEALQPAVEALQPVVTALVVIVFVCICLVAYDIYLNRKMLKQTAK